MDAVTTRDPGAVALRLDIEDFLYREAELVDERRFEEWLELFSDDLRYCMPMARNLRSEDIGGEYLTGKLDVYWIDEDKTTLATRITQIRTRVHWAEEPLSRTSHLVTNIRLLGAVPSVADAQEVTIGCKFLIYRNRNRDEEDMLIGKRQDRLRRVGESWQICQRMIYVDQSVLLAKSLSFMI